MRFFIAFVLLAAFAFDGSLLAQSASKATLPDSAISNFTWRSIGPANMSGRITAIAVYEKDPNQWWAASASGGLLKTTNNGVTFEHQFDREATISIGDVQVSQSDSNILWVGTGEGNPRNSSSWGDGVYKSVDGGKTWKNMGLKKIFQTGRIAIHPTDPNIVYVGALGRLWGPNEDRGLFKTIDGGETWKKILYVDDKTGVIDVQMNHAEPDTLLVATYVRQRDRFDGNDPEVKFGEGAGIYRTTDGGKSFAKITDGLPSVKMGRIGLNIYRKDPQQVYAVVESEKIGTVPKTFPLVGFNGESAEVGAKVTSVSKDSSAEKGGLEVDDIVISVDETRILDYDDLQKAIRARAAEETAKWEVVRDGETVALEITYAKREEPTEEQKARTRELRSNPNSPFSASLGGQVQNLQGQQGSNENDFGGVYHSADGGVSWKRINTVNPRPMYYSQIRVDPSDNQHLYVLGTQLYKSKDGGAVFTNDGADRSVHTDHHALWIDPNDGRHMILGGDGGLYITFDRMDNWDHYNHIAIGQFYHVGLSADENYKVYGGLQDNGSWGGPTRVRDNSGPVNTDWFRVGSGDGFICLVDPTDPNQIYFESQNGAMGRIHLETGARGFIRPQPPRGTRYRFNWKTPFLLSPHNPDIHYSAGNHVFRSLNKGDGIKAISPDITNTEGGAGSALSESPREEGVLYAGTTDGGLWMTKDGGTSWSNLYDQEAVAKLAETKASSPSRGPGADRRGAGAGGSSAGGQRQGQGRGAGSGGRSGGGFGAGRGGRGGPGRVFEMLKSQDSNGDGVIEASELPERMAAIIGRFDQDGDGKLSGKELEPPTDEETKPAPESGAEKPEEPTTEPEEPSEAPSAEKELSTESESAPPAPSSEGKSEKDEAGQEKPPTPAKAGVKESDAKKSDAAASPDDASATEAKPAEDETTLSETPVSPLSGTWEGAFQNQNFGGRQSEFTLVLMVQSDNKIKGSLESSRMMGDVSDGEYNSEENSFDLVVQTERIGIDFKGKIADGKMNGIMEINGGAFSMDFEAARTGDATGLSDEAKKDDGSKPIYELVTKPLWVSSLTASAFVDGRCYMSLDGHRSDDDKPYIFVTENYGQTWRSILANLPETAGSTRVLREDIENANVLYLGCEFSAWVSIDRGESWTRLNTNLPHVAVHEFAQHPTRGEIVAATHGRSLWIMDATALRQLSADSLSAPATLYSPNKVIRWRSRTERGSAGTRAFVGENPSSDATLVYSLGSNARSAKLSVTSLLGEELYDEFVPTEAGLHSITWDLRPKAPETTSGRGRRGFRGGRFRGGIANGDYRITLRVDGKEYHQTLSIVADPEYGDSATSEEEVEFFEALLGTED